MRIAHIDREPVDARHVREVAIRLHQLSGVNEFVTPVEIAERLISLMRSHPDSLTDVHHEDMAASLWKFLCRECGPGTAEQWTNHRSWPLKVLTNDARPVLMDVIDWLFEYEWSTPDTVKKYGPLQQVAVIIEFDGMAAIRSSYLNSDDEWSGDTFFVKSSDLSD